MYFNLKKFTVLLVIIFTAVLPFNSIMRTEIGIIIGALSTISIFNLINEKPQRNNFDLRYFSIFSLLFFISLLSVIFSFNDRSFAKLETQLSIFFLPFIYFSNRELINSIKISIQKTFVISTFVLSLVLICSSIYNYFFTPHFWNLPGEYFFYTHLVQPVSGHPTYVALIFLIAIILLFKIQTGFTKKRETIVSWISIFWFLFMIFILNSRGVLIISLSSFLCLLIINHKHNKYVLGMIISFLILFSVFSVYVLSLQKVPNRGYSFNLIEVFEKSTDPNIGNSNNGLTTRLAIWRQAIITAKDNFWFGVGLGNEMDSMLTTYKRNNYSYFYKNQVGIHNSFITIFVGMGVGGLLVFLTSIVFILLRSLKRRNQYHFIFLISFIFISIFESTLQRFSGVVVFSFFNIILFFTDSTKEDQNEIQGR